MTARLAAPIPRRPCFSTRATAAASTRAGTSPAGPEPCRPTPMPGSANCTRPSEVPGRLRKQRAGLTVGASSLSWAICGFAEIFAAEREINGAPLNQRHVVRQERIKPLVAALESWMRTARARLSRHADTAKAIDYMLKRWPAFARFLDDGRICLSNNAAERALRGIAIGRRAWLFAGSDRGGERAAAMFTLIEPAKLNGIDPHACLAVVIRRINALPGARLPELLTP